MERVLSSTDAAKALDSIGGKASNLAALERAGLPVPPWFVVTTAALADLIGRVRGELDALLAGLEAASRKDLAQASAKIGELFARTGLAPADRAALLERFDTTFTR